MFETQNHSPRKISDKHLCSRSSYSITVIIIITTTITSITIIINFSNIIITDINLMTQI
jgi:hypothetical protein